MKVEVVLTEADITQEFVEAMEARDLPEKFFYWFPRSAEEWSGLAKEPALYAGLSETWKALSGEAPALARHFGGRIPVISFGARAVEHDRASIAGADIGELEKRLSHAANCRDRLRALADHSSRCPASPR